MLLMVRVLLAAGALALGIGAASAQWVHTASEDDPFAGGATQLAAGLSEVGEMLAFRCTSARDLALLYVSIEKPDDALIENLAMFAMGKPALLVIVDDDPVVRLPAQIEVTPTRERLRYVATGEAVQPLARRVTTARKRIAVAFEFNGKRVSSTAVNARGTKAAVGKLTGACKLEADSAAAR
jgi:hypothetical protein